MCLDCYDCEMMHMWHTGRFHLCHRTARWKNRKWFTHKRGPLAQLCMDACYFKFHNLASHNKRFPGCCNSDMMHMCGIHDTSDTCVTALRGENPENQTTHKHGPLTQLRMDLCYFNFHNLVSHSKRFPSCCNCEMMHVWHAWHFGHLCHRTALRKNSKWTTQKSRPRAQLCVDSWYLNFYNLEFHQLIELCCCSCGMMHMWHTGRFHLCHRTARWKTSKCLTETSIYRLSR